MAEKKKGKSNSKSKSSASPSVSDFILKYAGIWLLLAVVLLYLKTFRFTGLTQLDDTIFIFDKMEFNKHFLNIFQAFNVGCFNEKDIYYRPIFLISFIFEYPLYQHHFFADHFRIYHLTNLVLHGADVLLLFALLKKINIPRHVAFVFALIYAVHPVLTMAVAWIPGRNDLLLALFTYSFFISVIRFSEKPNALNYAFQLVFYLLCLFTKETAAFIPFVTVLLFYCWKKDNLLQPKYFGLAGGWAAALALWYFKRETSLESTTSGFPIHGVIENFGYRLPGLLQYLGKVFLPFNLSVFPTIKETTYIYGIISIIGLTVIILLNKERDDKMVLLGAGWFIFFILPFFFVPKNINDQLFEHRLYLPIVGIFIMLSQSVLFSKKISPEKIMGGGILISCGLSIITFIYMNQFDNELVFWSNAVNHSPSSAYANKMYGIKLAEASKPDEAKPYFVRAYSLDSTERYTNLFLARLIYIPEDSINKAERALKNEVRLNSTFPDTYFELAHVYFMKNDLQDAKTSLVKFLSYRPDDKISNNNLMKLYIDLKEFKEAKEQIAHMEQMGIAVDSGTKAEVEAGLRQQ